MPEYVLRIVADGEDRGAVSLMGQIEGGLGRVGAGANVMAGIFQGAGIAAFNMLANVAGSAISAIGDSMIKGNAEFERYQTQFGVLLGSADAAKERLAALAEFGAKTPFELPEVVRADKILQAFGLHADDVAQRFGFAGEEIRTIAGDVAAGTGASFEEIAGYLGKFASGATGEAIARMQELGIVTRAQLAEMGVEFSKSGEMLTPVDEAMDILLGSMKDKFGGMMEAQSSTFEGMMSNFQDWLGAAGRTLGAPFFEIAKEGLGKTLEMLNGFMPTLQDAANALGAFFSVLMEGDIGGAFDALGAFESFQSLGIGPAIYDLGAAFETLWAALQSIDLTPIAEAFASLADAIGLRMPTAQESVSALAAGIATFAVGAADFLNNYAIPAIAAIVNFVAANWPTIQATVSAAMTAIQTVITTVLNWASAFWEQWGGTILAAIEWYTGQWKMIIDAFTKVLEGDWRGFGEILRKAWDSTWQLIQKITQDAIDKLKAVDWGKVGGDILRGIASGITAATGFIISAAQAAAQAALDALKGFLGIKSPSRVMADVIGKNMVLGIARGLTDNWRLVNAQIAQMPALAPLATAGASSGSGISNRSYAGDTFVLNVSGAESMGMAEAFIDARRRERFNSFMGEG